VDKGKKAYTNRRKSAPKRKGRTKCGLPSFLLDSEKKSKQIKQQNHGAIKKQTKGFDISNASDQNGNRTLTK